MNYKNEPIIEVDVHGLNVQQALEKIEKTINGASSMVYRIRVIHGFNGGTRIKGSIKREIGNGLNSKVLRIEPGWNEGITELVLREY